MVKANQPLLVIRFTQYKKIDFIGEHLRLINKDGFVWMLKTGRRIPDSSLKKSVFKNGIVILKAPKKAGGQYYFAIVDNYHNGLPQDDYSYPRYYDEMIEESYDYSMDGTWLKIKKIKIMEENMLDHLIMQKSGKNLHDVINSTRTSVLYAISDSDFDV